MNVEQQLLDVVETVHMPFPCLATVEQDIHMPRLPSLKAAKQITDKPVHLVGLEAFLDTDPSHYGLSGSPTQVECIFPPPCGAEKETWRGADSALRLHALLKTWKFV